MDNGQQIIADVLTQYFSKGDCTPIREFTKLFIEIKDKDASFTEDQMKDHIENTRSMLYKWKNKNNSRGISISNIRILRDIFIKLGEYKLVETLETILKGNEEEKKEHKIICDRISKGRIRYAWDVEQRDLLDNPFKYADCIKSKPPFLSDEEFAELNSLYPKRSVYEEILSKEEKDYSFETIKYLDKINRFISDSTTYKNAAELWKDYYIWYDRYKTGRLYGSNILEAPREIFKNLINIWFNYYRGSYTKSYCGDYLTRIGETLGLLSIEGKINYRDEKNYVYVGHVVKYHDGRNDNDLPTFSGSIPIINKVLKIDMGKLGDIIGRCYTENITRVEAIYDGKELTEERFKVEVCPNYLAREYYEWFLDNGFNNLDAEVISYFRKYDPDYLSQDKLRSCDIESIPTYDAEDEEDYLEDYLDEDEDFEMDENDEYCKEMPSSVFSKVKNWGKTFFHSKEEVV
jgi:hypothetical protein